MELAKKVHQIFYVENEGGAVNVDTGKKKVHMQLIADDSPHKKVKDASEK